MGPDKSGFSPQFSGSIQLTTGPLYSDGIVYVLILGCSEQETLKNWKIHTKRKFNHVYFSLFESEQGISLYGKN